MTENQPSAPLPPMPLSLANKVSTGFPQIALHVLLLGTTQPKRLPTQLGTQLLICVCVVCCMAKQDTVGNQDNKGLYFRVVVFFFSYSCSYSSFNLEAQRLVPFLVII